MIFLLMEIAFVIILLICLWCIINYTMLMFTKHSADKIFELTFIEINKQYEYISQILLTNNLFEQEQCPLSDETKSLINTASSFSVEKDGNERIIGYANAINKNMQTLIQSIKEEFYSTNKDIINYLEKQKEFEKIKKHYNETAKSLKHFVDVFPTSLMARLKNIRTMDFLD